ncbi:MAG TPA: hypothetical protein VMJ75_25130 [Candidatus Acidoferrales bacterium]|nr:hypothetical protein [Candidatus Acidoferrales bacterium]
MIRIDSWDDLSRRRAAVAFARKQLNASFLVNSMVERHAWRYLDSLRRYRRSIVLYLRSAS